MEMNKNNNNNNNTLKCGMKPKSLTPSVLGMPSSHGVKLSVNMTSEDKKELLSKLEEWRRARKDKLAARILTKQKQYEKTKVSLPVLPPKNRSSTAHHDGASKFRDRQSVFDRLYNDRKVKKPDVSSSLNKPNLTPKSGFRKSSLTPSEKLNEPVKVSHVGADGTTFDLSPESSTSVDGKEREVSTNDDPTQSAENLEEKCDAFRLNKSENSETTSSSHESASLSKENSMDSEKVPQTCQTEATEADTHESDLAKNVAVLGNLAAVPATAVQSFETQVQKNPLRRSISMMFRQKCRKEYTIRRSFSAKNLKEFDLSQRKLNHSSMRIVPQIARNNVREGKSEMAAKSVSFVTPKCNKSLGPSYLRNKLEDWLKKNGHPLEGYRHLRCFGISSSEKSFPSAAALPLDHSFENSYYATAPNSPINDPDKENLVPSTVVQQVDTKVVENWLKELHRLIVELKYPPERCEEWLTAIRKKCSGSTQLPIYWECLAALHELKGDLKSAIEDYERAIIKGGEVDAVGESLAQLFEKMVIEQKQRPKAKLEKGLDPKNIFKSTIIKFALQQKALKKLSSEIDPGVRQQLYVATPVRRSTRIQTPYKSTGEVASLQTLTPELRKNLIFKPNESLIRGD